MKFPNRASVYAVFFGKLTYPDGLHGCWQWNGSVTGNGYPCLFQNENRAHRWAFKEFVGPINAQTLDHLCRNLLCVNPAHMEPVSIAENLARQKAPRCGKGHAIVGLNLLTRTIGPSESISMCAICDRTARPARYRRYVEKQNGRKELVNA